MGVLAHDRSHDRSPPQQGPAGGLAEGGLQRRKGARGNAFMQERLAASKGGDPGEDAFQSATAGPGGGIPYRSEMEAAFGQDFSGVQAHMGGAETRHGLAALGARGAARGEEVAFATPNPSKELVAHELTHVAQQDGGVNRSSEVSRPGSPAETKADAVGARVAAGGAAGDVGAASGGIHLDAEVCEAPAPEEQVCSESDAPTPDPGPTQQEKDAAQDELLAWQRDALTFVDGNRQWLSGNWIAYLGDTSQNPRLGWQDGTAAGVISNALGNLLTELGTNLIKKGSAAAAAAVVGTAAAGPVGTVIGFCVGVIVESVASIIFEAVTGKSDADDAAAAAAKNTAGMIGKQETTFNQQGAQGRTQVLDAFGVLQKRLTGAETSEDVADVLDWASAERAVTATPPDAADRGLYERMLHDWVLEHAGDEEDANDTTSEAQWEAASKEVFGKEDADLDGHPEVFAYQTRGHWGAVGLPGYSHAQAMIDKVKTMQGEAQDPGDAASAWYDGKSFRFTSTSNADALIAFLDEEEGLVEAGKENIRKNQFEIDCALDLTTSDGACYVDEWEYDVKLTGDLPWYAGSKGSFTVSPD